MAFGSKSSKLQLVQLFVLLFIAACLFAALQRPQSRQPLNTNAIKLRNVEVISGSMTCGRVAA